MTNGIRNELRGVDSLNQGLWMIRQMEGQELWEGTGAEDWSIVVFVDLKAALTRMLTQYSKTDVIQGTIGGLYRIAFPHTSAAITIVDAIMKELGQ